MHIDEIFSEWEKDSNISPIDLSNESIRIPKLHHKYFRMLSYERMYLAKLEQSLKQLYKLKVEYYNGSIDQETLQANGWQPNRLKILKSDLSTYIDSDQDIVNSRLAISLAKEKVEVLDHIIRSINNRTFMIKNAIDFQKFQAGEN